MKTRTSFKKCHKPLYTKTGEDHHQYRHGMSSTRLYAIWNGIITRCENPKWKTYEHYGGAGIKMCKRWREDFVNFMEDMGETYFDGAQIDRIDNSKGYSPENCRWVTRLEQARNKSNVELYTYKGETLPASGWCEKLGLKKGAVRNRIFNLGWPVEKAITTPKKQYKNPGVIWDKARKKWRAYIKRDGKVTELGRFNSKKEAIKVRKQYEAESFR